MSCGTKEWSELNSGEDDKPKYKGVSNKRLAIMAGKLSHELRKFMFAVETNSNASRLTDYEKLHQTVAHLNGLNHLLKYPNENVYSYDGKI